MKDEWELSSNKFTILMPGRLTYWKGQEILIEALNILIEDYSNTIFKLFLGQTKAERSIKKTFEFGIEISP